jgi:hypothetical protein
MDQIDWDALYNEYAGHWSVVRSGVKPAKPFEPSSTAVARLAQPTNDDAAWFVEALRDGARPPDGRKWFVTALLKRSDSLAEMFFVPVLDAAIDEVDPSYNRYFVEPCMKAFGPRRVNEYLLGVVESGTDFRKAGAVNAMYWAGVPLCFQGDVPSFDIEHATAESKALYKSLQDIWERQRCLLLKTFVENPSMDLRRSIIPSLVLEPQAYPESHRALVTQAIDIARRHEDEYIRHRVEVQLGDSGRGFAPLPHRVKGATSA